MYPMSVSWLNSPRTAAAVLAALALLVYVATLYPGLPPGDSGEIVAAVTTGGVIHPPGYPLYDILAGPFVQLPMGSPAWRLNLFSAVTAALAVFLTALAVSEWTGDTAAGVAAAGLFAFASHTWDGAVAAEVFALNNLFVAALLLLAVRLARTGQLRYLNLGAFVFGLGVSNHQVLLFVGVPLGVWALVRREEVPRRPWRLVLPALLFVAGLTPYLWLTVLAANDSAAGWGDLTTWSGFLDHVLRRQYGTFQLHAESATGFPLTRNVARYLADMPTQLLGVGPLAAVAGLWSGLRDRSRRSLLVGTVAAWSCFVFGFHALANLRLDDPLQRAVMTRFWQMPNLLVCVWIGLLVARLEGRHRALRLLAVAAVALQLVLALPISGRRGEWTVRNYGMSLLSSFPPNALVLTRGDLNHNVLLYLQACEAMRPDVVVLDQELMTQDWYVARERSRHPDLRLPGARYDPRDPDGYSMRRFLDANRSRPVHLCGGWKPGDSSTDGLFAGRPVGFCDRITPVGEAPGFDAWLAESGATLPHPSLLSRPEYPRGRWEAVVVAELWRARRRRAEAILGEAIAAGDDPALLRLSADGFAELARDRPDVDASVLKNLGIALGRLARHDGSRIPEMIEAWERYLEVAPADDADRERIREALDAARRAGPP